MLIARQEIKQGLIIFFENNEQITKTLEYLEKLGYRWYSSGDLPTKRMQPPYSFSLLYLYDADERTHYKHLTTGNQADCICREATKFSDVFYEELPTEEILTAIIEICEEHSSDGSNCTCSCPFNHNEFCTRWRAEHPEETLKACYAWIEAKKDLEKASQPKICKERWAVKCLEDACYESPLLDTEENAIKFAKLKAKEKIFEDGNRSFYVVKVYTFEDYKEEIQ